MKTIFKFAGVAVLTASLAACGGMVTPGGQNAGVTGAAGGAASAGADPTLQRCAAPLGTIAVDDGRNADWWGPFGSATKLTTIDPLLRLAVQQSNCFVITSIGNQKTDARLSRITELQRNSGEYRAGSKQQKGQRVAADYYLEPAIIINDSGIGGIGGAIGGLVGNSAIAALAGSVKQKASVVTLTAARPRPTTAPCSAASAAAWAVAWPASRRRRKARQRWSPLSTRGTRWSSRCATTRRRT
jgi:hypothetical protein